MKCRIEINMDNAAFEDAGHGNELARILQNAARTVTGSSGDDALGSWRLRDINGNPVGHITISED
jgi:hypothetical protein